MHRALYSIEETRARLGGISRNSLYAMLRAGSLPSVVIGCRRFVSAEAYRADQEFHDIGEPIAGRCTVTAADGQCGPGPSFDCPSQHSL